MGRRGFGGSSRRSSSSSGTRSSSTSSNAKPATTQSRTPAQPQAGAAPATPMQQGGRSGGGFLRNVAELGAGIAVGHVAAHALENVLFGGKGGHSAEELKEAEDKVLTGPCSVQYESFTKCLNMNEDDVSQCEWAFDMFKECQVQGKQFQ